MPFGECTITLQDVAYQLGLPVDGRYVSGCLTDFHVYIEGDPSAYQQTNLKLLKLLTNLKFCHTSRPFRISSAKSSSLPRKPILPHGIQVQ
ncbi:hypothetical protein Ahy_B09g096126 isoform B [Arachis hypogaea]|nr:hypothetical protein Ahy_B09g096126 isoform B [Arachis hypogaea]